MDFATMTSLNTHARMQKMETQWSQRKSGLPVPELDGKKVKNRDSGGDLLEDMLRSSRENQDLTSVMMKLAAGKKLTASERQVLKEKSPDTYKKLVEMEREQKEYEARLKRCRTREEAAALRVSRLGTTMEKLKSANGDMKIIMECRMQVEFDNQAYRSFAKSREYKEMAENEAQLARLEAEEREKTEQARDKEAQKAEEKEEEGLEAGLEEDGEEEVRELPKAEKDRPRQELQKSPKRRRASAKKKVDPATLLARLDASKTAVEAYNAVMHAERMELANSLFGTKA